MDEILHAVSRALGRDFSFVRRFTQGTEGAFVVAHPPTAEQLVVKVWSAHVLSLNELSDHARWATVLRSLGWPIPEPILMTQSGHQTVLVEPLIDGTHPADITPAIVDEMLALGLATRSRGPLTSGWLHTLLEEVGEDVTKLIRPSVLRVHPVGAAVFGIVMDAIDGPEVATKDIVHGDFSPGNALIRDGHVLAIVDWQRARPGDTAFDIANLEFDLAMWGRGVDQKLDEVTVVLDELADARLRSWYRAYFAAWNLTWALGGEDEPQVVGAWEKLSAR